MRIPLQKLIIASYNDHKVQELVSLFQDMPFEIVGLRSLSSTIELKEEGETFADNALQKARTVFAITHEATLADDSGLEVFALDGAPGVYSARYAGEGARDEDNNLKLLHALQGVRDRRARFVSVLAFIYEESGQIKEKLFTGSLEGEILTAPRGTNGFGYDPLFYVPSLRQTLAELDMEQKNRLSHRARAFHSFKTWLDGEGL